MSLSGIDQFEKNLWNLIKSDTFQKLDEGERLNVGYRLLNSKYGIGSWFGFGSTKKLIFPKKE